MLGLTAAVGFATWFVLHVYVRRRARERRHQEDELKHITEGGGGGGVRATVDGVFEGWYVRGYGRDGWAARGKAMGLRGAAELEGGGTATATAGRVGDGREKVEIDGTAKRVELDGTVGVAELDEKEVHGGAEFPYAGKRGRRESRWPAKVQPWRGGLPPRLGTVYEVDLDCRWPA